jgi:hypothetical protein
MEGHVVAPSMAFSVFQSPISHRAEPSIGARRPQDSPGLSQTRVNSVNTFLSVLLTMQWMFQGLALASLPSEFA